MEIYSAANLPPRFTLSFDGPGRTRQSMKDECDINKIMAKFQKTGALTHVKEHGARYDFCTGVQFHEAMNVVKEGDRIFADLPSSLRGRFRTPEEFLDFVQDDSNMEEARELGLLRPEAALETPEARAGELPPAGEVVVPATSEAAVAAAEASD